MQKLDYKALFRGLVGIADISVSCFWRLAVTVEDASRWKPGAPRE
jgi:hypothetical protein